MAQLYWYTLSEFSFYDCDELEWYGLEIAPTATFSVAALQCFAPVSVLDEFVAQQVGAFFKPEIRKDHAYGIAGKRIFSPQVDTEIGS